MNIDLQNKGIKFCLKIIQILSQSHVVEDKLSTRLSCLFKSLTSISGFVSRKKYVHKMSQIWNPLLFLFPQVQYATQKYYKLSKSIGTWQQGWNTHGGNNQSRVTVCRGQEGRVWKDRYFKRWWQSCLLLKHGLIKVCRVYQESLLSNEWITDLAKKVSIGVHVWIKEKTSLSWIWVGRFWEFWGFSYQPSLIVTPINLQLMIYNSNYLVYQWNEVVKVADHFNTISIFTGWINQTFLTYLLHLMHSLNRNL